MSTHHRAYDRGELDLLPALEPASRAELAYGLTHVGLLALLRRLTAARWTPTASGDDQRQLPD